METKLLTIHLRMLTTVLVPSLVLWACTAAPATHGSDAAPATTSDVDGDDEDGEDEAEDDDAEDVDAEDGDAEDDDEADDEGDDEPATCGNAVCNPGETCSNCPNDCGACADGGTPAADECVASSGLKLQDQDPTDDQLPWKRPAGKKVTIYFETRNVTPVYLSDLQAGVANWNKSPCLDTRLVDTCPTGANCVTVKAPNPDTDGDGNFDAIERGGFTVGGHIDMLPGLSQGERRNVMIHEMGHAIGLRHRKTKRVLMNGDTYDDVFASDAIDYQNLLVLYGSQK